MVKFINNYFTVFVLYIVSILAATKDVMLALAIFFLVNALLTICIKIKFRTNHNKRYNVSLAGVLYDFAFSIIIIVLSKLVDDYVIPFDEDHFLKLTSSIIILSEFVSILKKFSIFTKNKMYSQITSIIDINKKRLIHTK
jgi:hypothetical protein